MRPTMGKLIILYRWRPWALQMLLSYPSLILGCPRIPQITTLNPHLTGPGEYSSSANIFNSLKLISGRETHFTKIHHKAPHISSKSLGVMSCPLGNWDDKFRRLATKSNIHASTTMSNQVRSMDAQQAHRDIWASQMAYSLPITGMNAKQLETIQRKARRASLGKMVFNQNFPQVVLHGPSTVGALNRSSWPYNRTRNQSHGQLPFSPICTRRNIEVDGYLTTIHPASCWVWQGGGITPPPKDSNWLYHINMDNSTQELHGNAPRSPHRTDKRMATQDTMCTWSDDHVSLPQQRHIRLSFFNLVLTRAGCISKSPHKQLHPTRNSGVQSNFTTKLAVDLATTTRPNAPTTRQLERSNY